MKVTEKKCVKDFSKACFPHKIWNPQNINHVGVPISYL